MNGYEIVDYLVKNKKTSVSENELYELSENNSMHTEIAILVLKHLYGAEYVPPFDAHFCGYYVFDNPNCEKVEKYQLYTVYLPTNEKCGVPTVESVYSGYTNFEDVRQRIKISYSDLTDEDIEQLKNQGHCWVRDNKMLFCRKELQYKS